MSPVVAAGNAVAGAARTLDTAASRQPGAAAWGGWDPFLDPLFNLRAETARRASTPERGAMAVMRHPLPRSSGATVT